MMEKNAKIYVAGHRGMVGSAIVRELKRQGYENIITRTHKELDLCRQDAVEAFFAEEKPEYVFLAAAKVGGIVANQEALADFMYDNMTLDERRFLLLLPTLFLFSPANLCSGCGWTGWFGQVPGSIRWQLCFFLLPVPTWYHKGILVR